MMALERKKLAEGQKLDAKDVFQNSSKIWSGMSEVEKQPYTDMAIRMNNEIPKAPKPRHDPKAMRPKRNVSPFVCFFTENVEKARATLKAEEKLKVVEIMKESSKRWSTLPTSEKKRYEALAAEKNANRPMVLVKLKQPPQAAAGKPVKEKGGRRSSGPDAEEAAVRVLGGSLPLLKSGKGPKGSLAKGKGKAGVGTADGPGRADAPKANKVPKSSSGRRMKFESPFAPRTGPDDDDAWDVEEAEPVKKRGPKF